MTGCSSAFEGGRVGRAVAVFDIVHRKVPKCHIGKIGYFRGADVCVLFLTMTISHCQSESE